MIGIDGIITYIVLATTIFNSGYLPKVQNFNVFLTHVMSNVVTGVKEAQVETLESAMINTISDDEQAAAFCSWLSTILEQYIQKIVKKDVLPFMLTRSWVLHFFFDYHMYGTSDNWSLIINNIDVTQLDDATRSIIQKVVIPYLQEQPTVKRFDDSLRLLCTEKFANTVIKEKIKGLFLRICLPIFILRLHSHLEKMNESDYLVSSAENLKDYVMKKLLKEQNQIIN